ncbi:MAG: nucleotidyltransferase domain-containing protein, partial [Pseudomonadota bacterium]
MSDYVLRMPKEAIKDFCLRHHIRKLSIFGSCRRGDYGPQSDVDVLVEFHPEHIPGLLGIVRMQRELSGMLDGRVVEIRTARDLSPYFRDEVVASAEA